MPRRPFHHNTRSVSAFKIVSDFCAKQFLATLSDFPIPGVTHLEIVEADLQVLENDAITPMTIESIRLMRNRINSIEEDAFRYHHSKHVLWVTGDFCSLLSGFWGPFLKPSKRKMDRAWPWDFNLNPPYCDFSLGMLRTQNSEKNNSFVKIKKQRDDPINASSF